jgi:hypothetical protein
MIEGVTQSLCSTMNYLSAGLEPSGEAVPLKKPRSENFYKILLSAHLDTR